MESVKQINALPLAGQKEAARGIVQIGCVGREELKTGSLPANWIVQGEPIPRAHPLTKSKDELFSSGLWDCTAGTFFYTFPCDEIVHVLEGEVIVREGEQEYTLRPGDVAFFPQGLTCQWEIPNYLKKFAIYRSASRTPLQKVLAKIKSFLTQKHAAASLIGLKAAHACEMDWLFDWCALGAISIGA